jgi:integrase
MPAVISRVPRYRRQKEKNRPDRAFVVIHGKKISLGRYGTAESYQRYAEVINRESPPKAEPQLAPSAPTISVLMADFLTHAVEKYGGERTSEVIHFRLAFRVLRRTHGNTLAKDFGPKAFQKMRQAMINEGWSRSYIGDQCQRVKRLIGWGVVEEMLPRDARHALDAVPGLARGEFGVRETDDVTPVADDVVAATLVHVGPIVADMIQVQRLAGMRPGELVQLASAHLDRSGAVWLFTPPRHKTQRSGKHRTIAIGPKAQAILSKYLFADRCFCYSSASYRRAVHRACDRAFPHPTLAGVKKSELTAQQLAELAQWQSDHRWSPNQLRHAAATTIRKEFGLEHAQIMLGHSRADVTQIYAERDLQKGIEVALKLG